jgi:hypothetical protein
MTRRALERVVGWELLGVVGRKTRWRLTLGCGHTRTVLQGYACAPDAYGAQLIHGKTYLAVPRQLQCYYFERTASGRRIGCRISDRPCIECVRDRGKAMHIAVVGDLCALHASRARRTPEAQWWTQHFPDAQARTAADQAIDALDTKLPMSAFIDAWIAAYVAAGGAKR